MVERTRSKCYTSQPPPKKQKMTPLVTQEGLLTSEPPTPHLQSTYHRNAHESPLLRLPAEIRHKIFSYVLGNRYIRFEYIKPSHQASCLDATRQCWEYQHFDYDPSKLEMTEFQYACLRDVTKVLDPLVPKLSLISRTCRQMYIETCLMHYELNIFAFTDVLLFNKWYRLLKAVQKRAIRRLDAKSQYLTPIELKEMTGLKEVYFVGSWLEPEAYLDRTIFA